MRVLTFFRSVDWVTVFSVVLLIAYGLVMLYSLGVFWEQFFIALLGIPVLFFVALLDYRYGRSFGWIVFAFGGVLLVSVALFGTEIRGAKSWFAIGPVTVQPVEIAKICLVLFFAKYFTEHPKDVFAFRHLLVSGGGALLYIVLTLLQPDLGSAVIFLGLFFAMAILVNVRRVHLVALTALFVIGAVLSWFFVFQDYHRERVLTLLQSERYPDTVGYNIRQAIVAVGSGGFTGKGLGHGTQSQLDFLPEQANDFLYAAVAEELGFLGAAVLLALLIVVILRLLLLSRNCRDDFGALVVFGIAIVFALQTVLNIGMNLGLLPVVGIPLPFVSAGGSSLILSCVAVGIALSVALRQRRRG